MRVRDLVLVAAFAPLSAIGAQRVILPRVDPSPWPKPGARPPEIKPVREALAYERSRWMFDAYNQVSSFATPTSNGSVRYTMFGSGTRAAYRATDKAWMTLDMADSYLGGPANMGNLEVGTRYNFSPWNERIRPYVDARGGYTMLTNTFTSSGGLGSFGTFGSSPANQVAVAGQETSRGFGMETGTGMEISVGRRFAIETGVSVMRDRMRFYGVNLPGEVAAPGNFYWMNSVRYLIGLKFNLGRYVSVADRANGAAVQRVAP